MLDGVEWVYSKIKIQPPSQERKTVLEGEDSNRSATKLGWKRKGNAGKKKGESSIPDEVKMGLQMLIPQPTRRHSQHRSVSDCVRVSYPNSNRWAWTEHVCFEVTPVPLPRHEGSCLRSLTCYATFVFIWKLRLNDCGNKRSSITTWNSQIKGNAPIKINTNK